jgi:hypothetical protein
LPAAVLRPKRGLHVKIIVLIRRKPGLSKAAFRNHYEAVHADLALRYIRPFLTDYRRSYPTSAFSYLDTVERSAAGAAPQFDYDCVTEMWFETRTRMEEMFALLSTDTVRRAIAEDEARFIDPQSVVVITCEESRSQVGPR